MASSRSEDGFTLVELLAATLLLVVGILGVLTVLDGSRDAVSRSEVRETAAHRGQRELERIRALPFAQLGLTSAPTQSTDPASPDAYIRSGNRYQWDPADAAGVADIVLGGTVVSQTAWDDGRHRGTLHAYVLRYEDTAVAGPVQARRVIVAVRVNGPWAPPRPLVFSTVVHDPAPNPA